MSRNYRYSDGTIRRILGVIAQNPGLTGGEIAEKLGLYRSNVNSFLYSWGKREHGLRVSNYRWYLPGQMAGRPVVVQERIVTRERVVPVPSRESLPTEFEIRAMSRSELERLCRRQDFALLDDRRLAAVGERKSEIEAAEERTSSLSRAEQQVPWFWIIAIAILVIVVITNNS
tara:strand:+ start:726 stop:1244 length:519 start_codon:yes stop_codon:yes gene_type:complete